MFTSKRQNYHHSKLPKLGDIGVICLPEYNKRKCIVSHFPLCDNILPYSKGIHTIFVRFLDTQEIQQFSGFWFESDSFSTRRNY